MPTPFHSAFRLALAAPLFVCATAPLILPMTPAYAAQVSSSETTFNIAPGSLTGALNQFSSQAGIYLAGSNELAAGKTSQGLQGRYSTAQGLARLVQEFHYTHEQAAQSVGRSRSAASNLLRLLNLAEPVQTMLMAGDIDMGHARALLALDKAEQITTANQITARKLSVREAESLVKKVAEADDGTAAKARKPAKSRDVQRVEEELSDLLMAQVEVRVKKRVKRHGKVQDMGEVSIQFGSLDELNGLIERLRG